MKFDELKTPAYVIDEKKLIHNLEILKLDTYSFNILLYAKV